MTDEQQAKSVVDGLRELCSGDRIRGIHCGRSGKVLFIDPTWPGCALIEWDAPGRPTSWRSERELEYAD